MSNAEAVERAVLGSDINAVIAALAAWRGEDLSPEERAEVRLDFARNLLERGERRQAFAVLGVLLGDTTDPQDRAFVLDLIIPLEIEFGDARKALSFAREACAAGDADERVSAIAVFRTQALHDAARAAKDADAATEADQRLQTLQTQGAGLGTQLRSAGDSNETAEGDERSRLVSVHFATHRSRTGSDNPYNYYATARAEVSFGKALVSVPKNREIGTITRPPKAAEDALDEKRLDPKRHFIIRTIKPISDRALFLEDVDYAAETSEHREAFIFVHGYNNSFAGALLRTAQLAVDLEIAGAAVLYSWPSRGSLLSYFVDRNQVIGPYIETLRQLIAGVAQQPNVKRVHLVAHSLGCKFMVEALLKLAAERDKVALDEIVFASPDVDVEDFNHAIGKIAALPGRVTVYTSNFDVALLTSAAVQSGAQAGRNPDRVAASGVAAIDTSAVKHGILGHSDFAHSAIDDVRAVIWVERDIGPEKRAAVLVPEDGPYGRYWRFEPEKPLNQDGPFRETLVWVRRLGLTNAAQTLQNSLKVWGEDARKAKERARTQALLKLIDVFAS